jgi:hypothetical protein
MGIAGKDEVRSSSLSFVIAAGLRQGIRPYRGGWKGR